jgi:hypothetical protein
LQSETGFKFDGSGLGETLDEIGHVVTKAGDPIRDAGDCGRVNRLFASRMYHGDLWISGVRTHDLVYLSVRGMPVADEEVGRAVDVVVNTKLRTKIASFT